VHQPDSQAGQAPALEIPPLSRRLLKLVHWDQARRLRWQQHASTPLELRERALWLWRSEQPRRPIAHVARELGIHPEVLRTWIRRDQADQGERTDLPTTAEREELQRLRKRVVELERANQILKAASAYFAGELDPTRRRS
jgi:transposase